MDFPRSSEGLDKPSQQANGISNYSGHGLLYVEVEK